MFIKTLQLQNFLSYGESGEAIDLQQLNVIIGTNASVYFFYRYQQGHPVLNVRANLDDSGRVQRSLRREDLKPDQSVLSQRKDPDLYPELTYLGNQFSEIRLYREWNLGRYTPPRMPQKVDLPEDFLIIVENLQKFYEPVEDITTKIYGGTVQIFLHEAGLTHPVPATRLSDGTLRSEALRKRAISLFWDSGKNLTVSKL